MDGPNIEKLFTETDCLTAQSNLKEICQYLRFFQTEGGYQIYLRQYLPKLAKPEYADEFNEFIDDLEDEEMANELKKGMKEPKKKDAVEKPETAPTPEVVPVLSVEPEIIPEVAPAIESTPEIVPVVKEIKKRGRKPKNS